MTARPVETARRQCVDMLIDFANAFFQRVEAIQRRDFTAFQGFDDCRGGHTDEIGHALPLAKPE